jgi:hypothetical protein
MYDNIKSMSVTAVRKFDLNIEKTLEGWEICHAIREVIANAIDEQVLTNTKQIEISKDSNGAWRVRDCGRGLKYEHLTQNENEEKLQDADKVMGKFGVGLKDALATLYRRRVGVNIRSKHGDITLELATKHEFSDVTTLHALISPPADPRLVGTEFILERVSDEDIARAKDLFLMFSGEEVLDTTRYGQVLRRDPRRNARIYVKGMRVAEEEKFAFSYNITSLTAAMNKALNRERTNVGRTAYADRVKVMLLASNSAVVAESLADDLVRIEQGKNHEEVGWVDVAVHACQILNASMKVVFVTASQRTTLPDAVDHAIADGYKVVTLPENIKDRLHGIKDIKGNAVRDLEIYRREWAESFEFKFVGRSDLSRRERDIFDRHKRIASLIGGFPAGVKEVKISETMRPDFTSTQDPVGLWESENRRIIIKRSQLRSLEAFAGTLLHEVTHARTGYDDVTREFEEGLTDALGKVSARVLKR